jgi:hypothetical protein
VRAATIPPGLVAGGCQWSPGCTAAGLVGGAGGWEARSSGAWPCRHCVLCSAGGSEGASVMWQYDTPACMPTAHDGRKVEAGWGEAATSGHTS